MSDPNANPNCVACKGQGWVLVRIDEDDVDRDVCECVCNPERDPDRKRFRCSIYVDVYAYTEEQAKLVAERLAQHLVDPDNDELPEGYFNPYFGGAAWLVNGDLLGNAKRLAKI